MIVAATTLGSFGLVLCTVMTFPPKLIASEYVPGATMMVSNGAAFTIAI